MSPLPPPSRHRWYLYGITILITIAGVWYFSSSKKKPPGNNRWGGGGGPNPAWAGQGKTPAMPVRAVPAERRDLPVYLKAIGTVTPLNTVTVQSRVDGQLVRVAFTEGQWAEKGQLLAEIDPAPYRIRLAQAEGQLGQNLAQLQMASADLERFKQLYDKKLVTSQQMETQQALVREREGAMASDQAAVDNARLQLAYTRIEAPIAGRLGLRRVDEGNLVRANTPEGLVVITQTRPITVMSTVPEVDLAKVLEPLRAGEQLAVEAWDRAELKTLARGVLKTMDNKIDLATGTLRLKAEFPNTDDSLFPNQFVNLRIQVRTLQNAVVIPSAAVQFGSRGTYVYIVNEKKQASVRDIVLGATEGLEQAVTTGLNPGDLVVLEGIDRLREGRDVLVVEDKAPVPGPAPVAAKAGRKK